MQTIITERGPQLLADALDTLAKQHRDDQQAYRVLAAAREELRALSWARYKARHEHSDRITVMLRRHKGHRLALEGRTHA